MLFLKKIEHNHSFEYDHTKLRLEFDVTDMDSPGMRAFILALLDLKMHYWNSDKLMALSQLMFEAEQETPALKVIQTPTITASEVFQKYGQIVYPGDTFNVLENIPNLVTFDDQLTAFPPVAYLVVP